MKEKFARWDTLFVEYLKRDWKKIIIWILGLGLFSGGFVPAFEEIGNDEKSRYDFYGWSDTGKNSSKLYIGSYVFT